VNLDELMLLTAQQLDKVVRDWPGVSVRSSHVDTATCISFRGYNVQIYSWNEPRYLCTIICEGEMCDLPLAQLQLARWDPDRLSQGRYTFHVPPDSFPKFISVVLILVLQQISISLPLAPGPATRVELSPTMTTPS